MSRQVAFTAILILVFSVTVIGQRQKVVAADSSANEKREESIGGAEAARAIDRLGELLPVAIRGRLREMRLAAYLPGPFLVNRIIAAEGGPVVLGQRVEQLKAALQPVLDYHERGKLPIYVLRSERPRAYFVERTLVIITTRLLQSASDEDIRGISGARTGARIQFGMKASKRKRRKMES